MSLGFLPFIPCTACENPPVCTEPLTEPTKPIFYDVIENLFRDVIESCLLPNPLLYNQKLNLYNELRDISKKYNVGFMTGRQKK